MKKLPNHPPMHGLLDCDGIQVMEGGDLIPLPPCQATEAMHISGHWKNREEEASTIVIGQSEVMVSQRLDNAHRFHVPVMHVVVLLNDGF